MSTERWLFAISGDRVSLRHGDHATISIPRPGQEHDQRRLRFLHVLQPVQGVIHWTTVVRIRYGKRSRSMEN